MQRSPKKVIFVGTAKEDLSAFPDEAKKQIGHILHEIAASLPLAAMLDVSSFVTVGAGAYEISVRTGAEGVDHRTFFVAKFPEAVYVLHAFEKKQQKTPQRDIAQGRKRYSEVAESRRHAIAGEEKKKAGQK